MLEVRRGEAARLDLAREVVPATSGQQGSRFVGAGVLSLVWRERCVSPSFLCLLCVFVRACAVWGGRAAVCPVRAARTSVRRPVGAPCVHPTQAPSSSACRVLGSLTHQRLVAPVRLRCRRGPKSTSGWAAGRPGLGELRFGSRAAPGGRGPALTTRASQSAANSRRKQNMRQARCEG